MVTVNCTGVAMFGGDILDASALSSMFGFALFGVASGTEIGGPTGEGSLIRERYVKNVMNSPPIVKN
jgi:hypothetical protein